MSGGTKREIKWLASAERTTTQTLEVTTDGYSGIIWTVDQTTDGTGSKTPSLQIKDANGVYKTIWTASAAIATATTAAYVFHSGATDAASWTEAVETLIPLTVKFIITAANSNAETYSSAICLIR